MRARPNLTSMYSNTKNACMNRSSVRAEKCWKSAWRNCGSFEERDASAGAAELNVTAYQDDLSIRVTRLPSICPVRAAILATFRQLAVSNRKSNCHRQFH